MSSAYSHLVVLEIAGADPAPGIGRSPDKRSSQGPLGLVDLGAGDLIDKPLVVFQGIDGMGDFDVHGAAGGDGLQVLGSHDAAHAGSAAGVFDAGHDIGIASPDFRRPVR